MDILRSPVCLQVAIFSLVVSGVPVFDGETCILKWAQYLFTAWVTLAYGSVGVVALYHLAADQSPVDIVYFESLLIWIPCMSAILVSISRRQNMRELFKKMSVLQESVQGSIQNKIKFTLALVTTKSLAYATLLCISFILRLGRKAKRLGLDFHENKILTVIAFFPPNFLWCTLYYSLNLVNLFELDFLEVAVRQQLFSKCYNPSVISVRSVISAEDSSWNEISQVNDSAFKCRAFMCRSVESRRLALQKLSKLKEIHNKNNQTFYIPYVMIQTFSTYTFLTDLSLGGWRFSIIIWISFAISIVLTIAFAVSLCEFHGLRISATRVLQSKIKREIYVRQDSQERKLLRWFSSSIQDPYPDHACIFFGFDFAFLWLVVETSCLVITTLYTGKDIV